MPGEDFDNSVYDALRTERANAWTVFFGVAAIVIAALVLVSRLLAALDGSHASLLAAGGAPADYAVSAPARPYETSTAMAPTSTDLPAVLNPPAATPAPAAETPMSSGGAPAVAAAEPPAPAPEATAMAPPGPVVVAEAAPSAHLAPPPPPTPPPAPALPPAPAVSARSVAIIERSCGALVYGKDETEPLPPASLTKIVTALVVAERATNLNAVVEDVDVSAKTLVRTTDSSVMGIEPGMRFTVRDLLYGLLLPSGNDAAVQFAEYISGGIGPFVALVNDKAAAIGMTDTHFVNPHGLDAPGHFSTALDMARAGRAFLANPLLAQIAATPSYETPGAVRIVMSNGNKLLAAYPGMFGVKIGYTTNAKQTYVAAARRGGRELVLSLFGSTDRYADAQALLDWAFASTPAACR